MREIKIWGNGAAWRQLADGGRAGIKSKVLRQVYNKTLPVLPKASKAAAAGRHASLLYPFSGAKLATAAGSATLPSPSKPQRSAALTAASSGFRPASGSTQAQAQLSRALWCSAVPNPGQFHFKEAPRAPTVANRLYAGDKPRLRGGKREGQARAKPRPLGLTRSCSGWRLSRRASFFFFWCFWRSTLAVPRNKSC